MQQQNQGTTTSAKQQPNNQQAAPNTANPGSSNQSQNNKAATGNNNHQKSSNSSQQQNGATQKKQNNNGGAKGNGGAHKNNNTNTNSQQQHQPNVNKYKRTNANAPTTTTGKATAAAAQQHHPQQPSQGQQMMQGAQKSTSGAPAAATQQLSKGMLKQQQLVQAIMQKQYSEPTLPQTPTHGAPSNQPQPGQVKPTAPSSKELTQLEIITSFMNKRLQSFKDKVSKSGGEKGSKDLQPAQHKILRDLLAQIAIVCGVCGPPQTQSFKNNGTIHKLKKLFTTSDEPSQSEEMKTPTQIAIPVIGTHKATKYSQTYSHLTGLGTDSQTSALASIQTQLPLCETQLSDLNSKLVSLQSDLKTKIQFSEERQKEKQQLLGIFESTQQPYVGDTHEQIKKVIAKELSIQTDLSACVEKLTTISSTLSDKVVSTVAKKAAELHAVNLLVDLISQT